jgi:hypothetical protein
MGKHPLMPAHAFGKATDKTCGNGTRVGQEVALLLYRFNRGFATHPATRRRVKMALQFMPVGYGMGLQFNPYNIVLVLPASVLAIHNVCNIACIMNYSFGKQKAKHQFKIVPRGSHGYRKGTLLARISRPVTQPDLQRFFNGHKVGLFLYAYSFYALNANACNGFHKVKNKALMQGVERKKQNYLPNCCCAERIITGSRTGGST